jgi:hypothetical protein
VITAHPELRERELTKLAALAAAFEQALRSRGVGMPAARLSAKAGVAVFEVGFDRWITDRKRKAFAVHVRESLEELKAMTAAVT